MSHDAKPKISNITRQVGLQAALKVKGGAQPHFWDLVFSLAPSSQISPRRQARLALVTLAKWRGNSCRTASGSGQGGLPAGYTPEAATSKCSLGLGAAAPPAAAAEPELLFCSSACCWPSACKVREIANMATLKFRPFLQSLGWSAVSLGYT